MIQKCSVENLIFGRGRSGKWNGIIWFIVQRSVEGIRVFKGQSVSVKKNQN